MRNTVLLIGRLTKDIELRANKNGTEVVSFTIAVARDMKNQNGEYETDFISCVAYKQLAKMMSEYSHKGDLIGVRGSIRTGSYEKDGKKIYTTDVVIDKLTFLSNKPKEVETKYSQLQSKTIMNEDYNQELKINDNDIKNVFGDLPF